MKTKIKMLTAMVSLSLCSASLYAADKELEIKAVSASGVPSFVTGKLGEFTKVDAVKSLTKYLSSQSAYGYSGAENFSVVQQSTDENGRTHTKYKQKLNGLNVYGASLSVHSNHADEIELVNGVMASVPKHSLVLNKVIKSKKANTLAVLKAAKNMGEVVSSPELSYVYVQYTGKTELVYRVEVKYGLNGMPMHDVLFFNAKSNKLVDRLALNHSATVKTYDLENKKIETQYDAQQHLPGKLLCTDNQNCHDTSAQQAHDGAKKVDEYYSEIHNRNSFDGNGIELRSSVHMGTNVNNAFFLWEEKQMIYGDGDGTTFKSFTSDFDVIAHEFTHGVTSSTANMKYQNASGALNESWSDVFGLSADTYRRGLSAPNSWELGNDLKVDGSAFRYMDNPTKDGRSADYWPERIPFEQNPNQNNDYGGVHKNSGIANLAYVLVVQGGTHPRGKTNIDVQGIGMAKAEKIWYHALVNYMGQNTNFAEARAATERSAKELYGEDEHSTVCNAWLAVGVDQSTPCADDNQGGIELENGIAKTGLSATQSSGALAFTFAVPTGAKDVTIETSGGSGDVDLYVKFGEKPTTGNYDCRPYKNGNVESCSLTDTGGTYYVMLNVYQDFSGVSLKGTYTADTGSNKAPVANFSTSCDELSCTFDSSSSNDEDGNIVSYQWSFGDNTTNTAASPAHTFASAGDYTVELIVTDNEGATDRESKTVTVSKGSSTGHDCSAYSAWSYWNYYYAGARVTYSGDLYQAVYTNYYQQPDYSYAWALVGACN